MRVLISTYGTRGDVQPFVALAKKLKARGHAVAVCTPSGFRPMVDQHGVDYAPMDNAVLEVSEAILRAPTASERRRLFKGFGAIIRGTLEDEWRAAQALRPDVLLYHSKALASHHIAEKLGVAEFLAMPIPLTPTRAFPVPMIPDLGLGGWFNRLSYKLLALANVVWAGATNDFRVKTLGLPPVSRFSDTMKRADGSAVPALYAFSEHLVPRPADWPASAQLTGPWFLDEAEGFEPPAELTRFLEEGPPPIYVGFGSMGAAQGERRARAILEAVALSGQRAIVASGWSGLEVAAPARDVFTLKAAPHDWLFPKVRAVVQHGGAGTTMAALRAGKPMVICPFFGDQPFWGRAVHRAGLGAKPLPQRKLTGARLADAIRSALAPEIVSRAEAVGERVRAEEGAARAVELIEARVSASRSS